MSFAKAQERYFHGAMKRGELKPSAHEEEAAPLPGHVKQLASGGLACLHCGGAVGEDGYAEGGPVYQEDDGDGDDGAHLGGYEQDEVSRMFDAAMRGGK